MTDRKKLTNSSYEGAFFNLPMSEEQAYACLLAAIMAEVE